MTRDDFRIRRTGHTYRVWQFEGSHDVFSFRVDDPRQVGTRCKLPRGGVVPPASPSQLGNHGVVIERGVSKHRGVTELPPQERLDLLHFLRRIPQSEARPTARRSSPQPPHEKVKRVDARGPMPRQVAGQIGGERVHSNRMPRAMPVSVFPRSIPGTYSMSRKSSLPRDSMKQRSAK